MAKTRLRPGTWPCYGNLRIIQGYKRLAYISRTADNFMIQSIARDGFTASFLQTFFSHKPEFTASFSALPAQLIDNRTRQKVHFDSEINIQSIKYQNWYR